MLPQLQDMVMSTFLAGKVQLRTAKVEIALKLFLFAFVAVLTATVGYASGTSEIVDFSLSCHHPPCRWQMLPHCTHRHWCIPLLMFLPFL